MSESGEGWVRYLSEWGCGATLTREDPEIAAIRALRDAMSRTCHMNFEALEGIDLREDVLVDALVAVPNHGVVRAEVLEREIPMNCLKRVRVVEGGLAAEGAYDPRLGRRVKVVIAVAYVTIYVRRRAQQ